LLSCGGCFFIFGPTEGPPKEFDTDYTIIVQSDDAREITLYLPFPHYKGKPDMRYLKWLRENLDYHLNLAKQSYESVMRDHKEHCRRNKIWYEEHNKSREEYEMAMKQDYGEKVEPYKKNLGFYSNIKMDLINTEYGKMLYIYIPYITEKMDPIYLEVGEHSQPIKINHKTVVDDYKLTGEDRIKPEREWRGAAPRYDWHMFKRFNMPVYVQFEGKKLDVSFGYSIMGYKRFSMWDGPACTLYIGYCGDFKEDKDFVFTKSGWQEISLEKMSLIKEEER
ncbi:MAG: hypothetical protein AB1630_12340, partial [bacterium]